MAFLAQIQRLQLCALCAAISACATHQPLPPPDRTTPAAYRNAAASAELPRPATEWWREFSSPELDHLVESALANNRELRVAIARVAQARAQARIAEASRAPAIEAFARREHIAPEGGPGSVIEEADWRAANRVRFGLRTAYELDLWGRQEYAAESALALAAASEFHRDAVALSLTTDVAVAYFEYLSLAERSAIALRGAASHRNLLAAVARQAAIGDATSVDVAQQRVLLAVAESAAATLTQRRERAFNRLALLTGIAPAALRIESHGLEQVAIPHIRPGLPSELLRRRPEIRRAEAQLAAADFDVQSVRANLLPSFSLVGEIGLGSRNLAALTGPGALFYLLATTLSKTVYDAGRKEGQLELARARHLEMLEQYSGALLTALREVEDALVATRLTADQHAARLGAVRSSRSNYTLHRRSLAAGGVDQRTVLDTEQRMYASEDAAAESLHDRLRAAIDLYKALGGGSRGDAPARNG